MIEVGAIHDEGSSVGNDERRSGRDYPPWPGIWHAGHGGWFLGRRTAWTIVLSAPESEPDTTLSPRSAGYSPSPRTGSSGLDPSTAKPPRARPLPRPRPAGSARWRGGRLGRLFVRFLDPFFGRWLLGRRRSRLSAAEDEHHGST